MLKFIEHKSAPVSNAITFSNLNLTPYNRVLVMIDGITVDTDDTGIYFRLEIDGTLHTTGYLYNIEGYSSGANEISVNSQAGALFPLAFHSTSNWKVGNAAGECYTGNVTISNVNTSLYKHMWHEGLYIGPTGNCILAEGGCTLSQHSLVTGMQIYPNANNILTGNATLYGVLHGR